MTGWEGEERLHIEKQIIMPKSKKVFASPRILHVLKAKPAFTNLIFSKQNTSLHTNYFIQAMVYLEHRNFIENCLSPAEMRESKKIMCSK